jgi:hypothetical protein
MEEVKPKKQHSIAVTGFDGEDAQIIHADELRVCVPTKQCIQFWATIIACFVAVVIGVVLMTVWPPTSAYFPIGNTMMGMGIGVLIPGDAFWWRGNELCLHLSDPL